MKKIFCIGLVVILVASSVIAVSAAEYLPGYDPLNKITQFVPYDGGFLALALPAQGNDAAVYFWLPDFINPVTNETWTADQYAFSTDGQYLYLFCGIFEVENVVDCTCEIYSILSNCYRFELQPSIVEIDGVASQLMRGVNSTGYNYPHDDLWYQVTGLFGASSDAWANGFPNNGFVYNFLKEGIVNPPDETQSILGAVGGVINSLLSMIGNSASAFLAYPGFILMIVIPLCVGIVTWITTIYKRRRG